MDTMETGKKHVPDIGKTCFSCKYKMVYNNAKCFKTRYTKIIIQHLTLFQKQPLRGLLKKKCSENMQQIYRRIPMPKCDFNKVAKQLYWNRTSAWVFSCKFTAYFQNIFFPGTPLDGCFCVSHLHCRAIIRDIIL